MPDLNRLNELHLTVRSKILEQIQQSLEQNGTIAASTQYTKSDGTNYGMYQKGDVSLTDLWDSVILQRNLGSLKQQIDRGQGPIQ